jgi:hypothetical protein
VKRPPRAPLPSQDAQYLEDRAEMRIGVACSGGGIRSAAFSLGALQALQEQKVLPRVEYVAAVSGGNYVASALAITAAESDEGVFTTQPPWAQGSPEERYLRHHTDYLAPGVVGRLWLAANFVYGFVVNYLPFVLSAFLAGRVGGWIVRLLLDDDGKGPIWRPDHPRAGWARGVLLIAAAVLAGVGVASVLRRRLTDGRAPSCKSARRAELVGGTAFGLGLALAVLALVTPALLEAYRDVSLWMVEHAFGKPAETFDTEWFPRIAVAAIWLVVALLLAVSALVLSRRSRSRVLTLIAGAGASGLLLVPFASSFEYATTRGVTNVGDVLGAAIALLVLLLMAVFVHNRRYSMHFFYRERLCSVYAVARHRDPEIGLVAGPLPYGERIWLSKIGQPVDPSAADAVARRVPKLVVCCAVNVTSHEAPIGRFAGSFTFEAERSGSPLLGYRSTKDYERDGQVPGTAMTLPSMMAVSGAALSPMMGRFTHPALRFLMALTNVRLGVWIPNGAMGDLAPRAESIVPVPWWRRLAGTIAAGWHEPGAWYVWREAIGTTGSTRKFIYVSDGGHFENLGLVELIRRRCTHILCFDASLDTTGDALDIGRAIALARADLGAEIELDPTPTLTDGTGASPTMVASGRVRYPDGQVASLILTRAALTEKASWDLRSFAKRDRLFPNHSTRQQLFTDEQFQAYRSLGHQGGLESVAKLNLPTVFLSTNGDSAESGLAGLREVPHE